jgi:hypothetical protein
MPFAAANLYRVQTKDGLFGVTEKREPTFGAAVMPITCPIEQGLVLHIGQARQLAKWAKSYGIDACYRLHKKSDPMPPPLFKWPNGAEGFTL